MESYDVQEIVSRIKGRRESLRAISEGSGVPVSTIRKLLRKKKPVRNPRVETFRKLVGYFGRSA